MFHLPPHLQAVVLGNSFTSFAANIAVAEGEKNSIVTLLPVVERVRICMLEAGGVISPDLSPAMAADRNELPARVTAYK